MSEEKIHEHSHSHKKKDETIKFEITKARLWQGISAILVIVILFMWFAGPTGQGAPQVPTPTPTPTQQQAAPEQARQQIDIDDDPVLGNKDAPVTIVSFEDYQCPFCKRSFDQTFPLLKKEYIDTGKVRYVFRDFPLNFHPQAQSASEASECADDQGKFWEYHGALFQNQESLGDALYKKIAEELELNVEQFNSCLDSGKYRQEVQNDFSYGTTVGVSGTPTFFINGIKLVGAQPFQAFQQVIEAELNQ